jgi:hypothetical protein
LGFRGTGAKFEEILVVTETDAYLLDDALPHVRGWRETDADADAAAITRAGSMSRSGTESGTDTDTSTGTGAAA